MTDKRAPHLAILNINIEVYEVLSTGECSASIVSKKELDESNIKKNFLMSVKGYNLKDCLEKLKRKIEEFDSE